ncbi:hypothetical protein AB6806_19835 [Bosea sp. RCC_152_1]|uniref:hypothetical protein n=1 Tax=Bosea sp. RCC_152_1 TaxID=3239228 RepID=UPI0035250706
MLSRAEVQGTLKIVQRGKWDIARLAFDPFVGGAKACGDMFRADRIRGPDKPRLRELLFARQSQFPKRTLHRRPARREK